MRILVIDDDPYLARAIRRALSGDDVVTEIDPVSALACVASAELDQAPFELVLCDFTMPRMNGVEVMNALRGRHAVPMFILMSGDEVDAPGADAVLLKPFGCTAVRDAVAQIRKARGDAPTARIPRAA